MIDTIRPPTTMLMYDNGERANDGDHPVETTLQFCLIEFGNASGQCRELTGFLANAQHANCHGRQYGRARERIRKPTTVADAIGSRQPYWRASAD